MTASLSNYCVCGEWRLVLFYGDALRKGFWAEPQLVMTNGRIRVWRQERVIWGITFDTRLMSITLPEARLAGSHVLIGSLHKWNVTHVLLIKSLQLLRGRMGHFRTTNPI